MHTKRSKCQVYLTQERIIPVIYQDTEGKRGYALTREKQSATLCWGHWNAD